MRAGRRADRQGPGAVRPARTDSGSRVPDQRKLQPAPRGPGEPDGGGEDQPPDGNRPDPRGDDPGPALRRRAAVQAAPRFLLHQPALLAGNGAPGRPADLDGDDLPQRAGSRGSDLLPQREGAGDPAHRQPPPVEQPRPIWRAQHLLPPHRLPGGRGDQICHHQMVSGAALGLVRAAWRNAGHALFIGIGGLRRPSKAS